MLCQPASSRFGATQQGRAEEYAGAEGNQAPEKAGGNGNAFSDKIGMAVGADQRFTGVCGNDGVAADRAISYFIHRFTPFDKEGHLPVTPCLYLVA